MQKEFPFPDLRVRKCTYNPDPEVPYLEKDESSGNEVVKVLPASLFLQKFPLVKDEVKLQDYIEAGIPLREVATHIYESNDSSDYPFTQDELYSKFEELVDKYKSNPENE